jgi:AraC-like DNA-binding protein
MEFVLTVYPPSPDLRPFVHSYVGFAPLGRDAAAPGRLTADGGQAFPLASGDPMIDRLIPSVCVCLDFNLGGPFALDRGDGVVPFKERAHVIGPITRPGRMLLPDRPESFGVSFQPGRAQHFLGTSIHELTDQFLALDHFWGAAARALEERLLAAPTARERIRLLETELRRRLEAAPPPDRIVPAIADEVFRCRGATTVERLSAASGLTRQHLARKFRCGLGVSPKLFCRLVRFHNTLTRALTAPPDNWAAAALELGYYDQAHLIAELKEFTGLTPTGLASLR